MEVQESLRTLIGYAFVGASLFVFPFFIVFFADMGTRWFARIGRLPGAILFGIAGPGLAAIPLFPSHSWMDLLTHDSPLWATLPVLSLVYWVSLAVLGIGSSIRNFEEHPGMRYYPGIRELIDIDSGLNQAGLRRRSYELGRFWFVRWTAGATGVALEVGFFYIWFFSTPVAEPLLQVSGLGIALGAAIAAFVVGRVCRRRYLESRILRLAVNELGPEDSEQHLRKSEKRRDELPVLLERAALCKSRSLRRNGGSGRPAMMFVLLGTSRFLQEHSSFERGLRSTTPGDVRSVLLDLIAVLMNPRDEAAVMRLADKVRAFESSGKPDQELEAKVKVGFDERLQAMQPTVRALLLIVVCALLILATLFALLGITGVDLPIP